MLLHYLCNVRPAWSRDGCTLRTGRKGSPPGHGPSRKAVSMATSGRGGSSCSGSSSPCGAPCPCLWAGTSPCSAFSFAGLRPVVATHLIWHYHLSLSFIFILLFKTFLHQHLSEAFQVKYEDVRQGPQTELDAALLKLLTVRTPPRIIRSQLRSKWKKINSHSVVFICLTVIFVCFCIIKTQFFAEFWNSFYTLYS